MTKKLSLKERLKAGAFTVNPKKAGYLKLPKEHQELLADIAADHLANRLGGVSIAAIVRGFQADGIKITKGIFEGYLDAIAKEKR